MGGRVGEEAEIPSKAQGLDQFLLVEVRPKEFFPRFRLDGLAWKAESCAIHVDTAAGVGGDGGDQGDEGVDEVGAAALRTVMTWTRGRRFSVHAGGSVGVEDVDIFRNPGVRKGGSRGWKCRGERIDDTIPENGVTVDFELDGYLLPGVRQVVEARELGRPCSGEGPRGLLLKSWTSGLKEKVTMKALDSSLSM